jgi:hypothetical protein
VGSGLPTTIDNILPDAAAKTTANGVNLYVGGPQLWGTKGGLVIQRTPAGTSTIPLIVSAVQGSAAGQNTASYFSGSGVTSGLGAYCGLTTEGTPPDWRACSVLAHATNDGKFFGQLVYGFAGGTAARYVRWDTNNASTITAQTTAKQVDICNDNYGIQLFGTQIAAFTGAHDALYDKTKTLPTPGDIVVDYRVVNALSINDAVTEVQVSSKPNQKNTLGVFVEVCSDSHVPSALASIENVAPTDEHGSPSISVSLLPEFANIRESMHFISVNSVGEGLINVCGENGDFEAGDLIVTSSMPGKGMKQSDDFVRACTVAKIREAVTFSSPTEVKTVACIYMCG